MEPHKQWVRTKDVHGHIMYRRLPAPQIGELQWCESCADYSEVVELPDYWYATCKRTGCFQALRIREKPLMSAANKHVKSTRHVVLIRHMETVVREWDPSMNEWVERLSLAEIRVLKAAIDGRR